MSIGSILWTIVLILIVLWLIGFAMHIAGGLIHLLLIVAAVLVIYNLIMSSRSRHTV
jgi:hypothetical protein